MPTGISNAETNDSVVFIPRRGEKDFEPIKLDDQVLQAQGTTALLSDYQSRTLNESRAALFSAISSGTRSHSSKSYNSFTWRPQLEGGRATCDSISSYGIHFLTVGRHNTERKRVELFPEEALYLVERGVLELWKESTTEAGEVLRVPMSVQQAWVELIGSDELTLERFQVCPPFISCLHVLSLPSPFASTLLCDVSSIRLATDIARSSLGLHLFETTGLRRDSSSITSGNTGISSCRSDTSGHSSF